MLVCELEKKGKENLKYTHNSAVSGINYDFCSSAEPQYYFVPYLVQASHGLSNF